MMIDAPGIAKAILPDLLDVLEQGNIHAHRHITDQLLMDGIAPDKPDYSREASEFSDALMDISYLLEKLQGGKNLGEVIRSSKSIITKNAVLRVGAAELLDPESAFETVRKPEDEKHRHLLERAVLNQIILLLDIYETSLKDKDIAKLQTVRAGLKKELAAIRSRADKGDEKAKSMLAGAQEAVDNARLSRNDKRYTFGTRAATNFLRNRVYARILHSTSSDIREDEDTHEAHPGKNAKTHPDQTVN